MEFDSPGNAPESYWICEDKVPTLRRRWRRFRCLGSIYRIGHSRLRAIATAGAAVDLLYPGLRSVDFMESILLGCSSCEGKSILSLHMWIICMGKDKPARHGCDNLCGNLMLVVGSWASFRGVLAVTSA